MTLETLLHDFALSPAWYFTAGRGLLVIIILMSIAAYSVLLERKASAWIQGRIGPNRTNHPLIAWIPGIGTLLMKGGFIQPAADGLKFLFKEDPLPGHVRKVYYILAPIIALAPALVTLTMLPFGEFSYEGQKHIITLCPGADVGVLFMFAISSLGVYGIAIGGWAANSKFPFLGAVRGSAQLISYELAMGLSVLTVFLATATPNENNPLSLVAIVNSQTGAWNILYHPVAALIFLIAIFAETNRHPFDMPESETDLVGGFHTEYGAFKFGLFFVAEYGHMIIGSSLFILMFLGGWHVLPWLPTVGSGAVASLLGVAAFFVKLAFFLFFFVWVRWTIPRFRYDQVMRIGWRVLLPVAILNLLAYFAWYALRG
jgi:NADH-quinone oxidoreductase subunit H